MMFSSVPSPRNRSNELVARITQQWLQYRLADAMQRAGWNGDWLIDDVATAIAAYFGAADRCTAVQPTEIEKTVRKTLRSIGYGELASHFHVVPIAQSVCLSSLAHASGLREEGSFYVRLESCLRDSNARGIMYLHLHGLAACEGEVRRAEGWFPSWSCYGRSEKVVKFIRLQLRQLSWPYPFCCAIT